MARPFLTARWRNVFLATYAVPPALLERRLPPALALDTLEGQAFVSLVAFEFLDTRVLGVSFPGYRNFPEVNLRFYVRRGAERGVMFVREFVPRRLIASLARFIYNEPYLATPMQSAVRATATEIAVEHRLRFRGRMHRIAAVGTAPSIGAEELSEAHFFKEHRWGYGVARQGQTVRYEVAHPVWKVYPVREFTVDVDWARLYGPEWGFLSFAQPRSTILAAGSAVSVYRGQDVAQLAAAGSL